MGERISQKILKSGRKRTPKNKKPAREARIEATSRIFEYIFQVKLPYIYHLVIKRRASFSLITWGNLWWAVLGSNQ